MENLKLLSVFYSLYVFVPPFPGSTVVGHGLGNYLVSGFGLSFECYKFACCIHSSVWTHLFDKMHFQGLSTAASLVVYVMKLHIGGKEKKEQDAKNKKGQKEKK